MESIKLTEKYNVSLEELQNTCRSRDCGYSEAIEHIEEQKNSKTILGYISRG